MVRVFAAYHCRGQNVNTTAENIVASCVMDDDHIILVKSNNIIEIRCVSDIGLTTIIDPSIKSTSVPTSSVFDTDETASQRHFSSVFSNVEKPISLIATEVTQKPMSLSFPTVDFVFEISYCKEGNYIVTLEKDQKSVGQNGSGGPPVVLAPSGDDMVYCRVYTNWWCVDPISGCNNILIRARIADKVTPNILNTNSLEVIELKSMIGQKNIACCQVTGNILIAVDKSLIFYKFKSCTSKSTKLPYIDFQEVPIVVDLEFIIERIAICENFFICGNSDFTVVLKILCDSNLVSENEDFSLPNSSSSSVSLASSLQLHNDIGSKKGTEHITSTENDHPHNFQNNQITILNEITMISTEDDIKNKTSASLSNIRSLPDMLSQEYKPIYADIKCKLRHITTNENTAKTVSNKKTYKLQTMLKIRKRDNRDSFVCLCMKPIYMMNTYCGKDDSQVDLDCTRSSNIPSLFSEFQSIYNDYFIGVSVLVTTSNDGYAYQFTNNEKLANNDSSYIATYPFTASVIDVAMTDFVLHALTDHGIETYTLRTGHKVFYNLQFSPSAPSAPLSTQTSSKLIDPVCLIGLRQFIGVQKCHCTDSYLILLASTTSLSTDQITNEHLSADQSSSSSSDYWTIYNIKLPTPQELSFDLNQLACQHKNDSLITYKLLMNESHMICRIAYQCFIIKRNGDSAILNRYSNINCYKELFLQSCLTLGDLYVTSIKPEEYCQALPYYIMAGVLIDEVFVRAMQSISSLENKPGKFNGLIYTIKNLFIKLYFDANDLISRMLLIPNTPKCGKYFLDGKSKCFGDELLELFLSEPDQLNELFILNLQSLAFRETMSGKVYQIILNRTEEKSNEEWLCLILELAKNKKTSAVHNILAELSLSDNYSADSETKNRLFTILIKYWNVLFENTNITRQNRTVITFSELTESFILTAARTINKNHQLQTTIANIFIYLVIELRIIKIEILVKLILNFLAGQVCDQACYHSNQFILQCLLEFYLYQNHYNNIEQLKFSNSVAGIRGIDRNTCNISLAEIEPGELPQKYDSKGAPSASTLSLSQSQFKQEYFDGISITSTSNNTTTLTSNEFGNEDLMKILIRIYMGKLTKFDHSIPKTINFEMIFKFLRENIDEIFQYHKSDVYDVENDYNLCAGHHQNNDCKTILNIKPNQRPILFLNARPVYLNSMSPFGKHFNIQDVNTKNCLLSELEEDVIKFQSILSSGQLSKEILQEIIYFFDTNLLSSSASPFTGIESFLCILLPVKKCIQFLIENSPNDLLRYVVTRFYNEEEWLSYLNELFSYNNYIAQKYSQEQFRLMLKETLKHLATAKKLPQIIQIFSLDGNYEKSNKAISSDMFNYYPNIVNYSTGKEKNKKYDLPLMAMSIEHQKESLIGKMNLAEEDILLINHLTEVIDLDRTERLGEMIKTTGYQLYETYNRNKQFFN